MLTGCGAAAAEAVADGGGGGAEGNDAPGGRAPDGAGLATACAGEGAAVPIIICEKLLAYALIVSGTSVRFAGRPGLASDGRTGGICVNGCSNRTGSCERVELPMNKSKMSSTVDRGIEECKHSNNNECVRSLFLATAINNRGYPNCALD